MGGRLWAKPSAPLLTEIQIPGDYTRVRNDDVQRVKRHGNWPNFSLRKMLAIFKKRTGRRLWRFPVKPGMTDLFHRHYCGSDGIELHVNGIGPGGEDARDLGAYQEAATMTPEANPSRIF